MEIESVASLRNIINQQNKLIDFLYKEQETFVEKNNKYVEKINQLEEELYKLKKTKGKN